MRGFKSQGPCNVFVWKDGQIYDMIVRKIYTSPLQTGALVSYQKCYRIATYLQNNWHVYLSSKEKVPQR